MMCLMEKRSLLRKNPVYKVSESLEQVTAKYFKEEEISVKTKEPTVIVRTDNQIPKSYLNPFCKQSEKARPQTTDPHSSS